jgi:hypothetical protein
MSNLNNEAENNKSQEFIEKNDNNYDPPSNKIQKSNNNIQSSSDGENIIIPPPKFTEKIRIEKKDEKVIYDNELIEYGKFFHEKIETNIKNKINEIYNEKTKTIKQFLNDDEMSHSDKKNEIKEPLDNIKSKIINISKVIPELKLLLKRFKYTTKNISFIQNLKPFLNPYPFDCKENPNNIIYVANIIASVFTDGSVTDILEYFKNRFTDSYTSSDFDNISKFLPLYCYILNNLAVSSTVDFSVFADIEKIKLISGKKELQKDVSESGKKNSEEFRKYQDTFGKSKKGKPTFDSSKPRYSGKGGASNSFKLSYNKGKGQNQRQNKGKGQNQRQNKGKGQGQKKNMDMSDLNILQKIKDESLLVEKKDSKDLYNYITEQLKEYIENQILEKAKGRSENNDENGVNEIEDLINETTQQNKKTDSQFNNAKSTDKYFITKDGKPASINNKQVPGVVNDNDIITLMFDEDVSKTEKIDKIQINDIFVELSDMKSLKSIIDDNIYFRKMLVKLLTSSITESKWVIHIKNNEKTSIKIDDTDFPLQNNSTITISSKNLKKTIDVPKSIYGGGSGGGIFPLFKTKNNKNKNTTTGNNQAQMKIFKKLKQVITIKHFNQNDKIKEEDLEKIRKNLVEYLIGLYSFTYQILFQNYEEIEKELKCVIESKEVNGKNEKINKRQKRLENEKEKEKQENSVNTEVTLNNETNTVQLLNNEIIDNSSLTKVEVEAEIERLEKEFQQLPFYDIEGREQISKKRSELKKKL